MVQTVALCGVGCVGCDLFIDTALVAYLAYNIEKLLFCFATHGLQNRTSELKMRCEF